jgi:hypothetical protein
MVLLKWFTMPPGTVTLSAEHGMVVFGIIFHDYCTFDAAVHQRLNDIGYDYSTNSDPVQLAKLGVDASSFVGICRVNSGVIVRCWFLNNLYLRMSLYVTLMALVDVKRHRVAVLHATDDIALFPMIQS